MTDMGVLSHWMGLRTRAAARLVRAASLVAVILGRDSVASFQGCIYFWGV